jgi:hypothetical protein
MSSVADCRSEGVLEKPSGKPATLYVKVLKLPVAACATPVARHKPATTAAPKPTRSIITALLTVRGALAPFTDAAFSNCVE